MCQFSELNNNLVKFKIIVWNLGTLFFFWICICEHTSLWNKELDWCVYFECPLTQAWSLVWYYSQSHHWQLSCQRLGHGFGHRDGWGRMVREDGEGGRERLVLVAAAWRACMSSLLFCCFVSECTSISSIYLSSTPSAEDAGMTGDCFYFTGQKHWQRNDFALSQNLKFYMLFVLYSHRCWFYEGRNPMCM